MKNWESTSLRRRHRRAFALVPLLVVIPLLFAFGPCDPKPPPSSTTTTTTAPPGSISPAAVKSAVEGAAGITLTEQPLSDDDHAAGGVALFGYGGGNGEQVTVAVYDTDAHAQQGLVDMGSPTEAFQHKNVVVIYYPPADGGASKRAAIEAAVTAL